MSFYVEFGEKLVAFVRFLAAGGYDLDVFSERCDVRYLVIDFDLDAFLPYQVFKGMDYLHRVLGLWENAAVFLGYKPYSVGFKPFYCVVRREDVEQPLHQPVSSRIDVFKIGYVAVGISEIAEGIGEVASAATCD